MFKDGPHLCADMKGEGRPHFRVCRRFVHFTVLWT